MFCGKCGRKLEENETCNCSAKEENHVVNEQLSGVEFSNYNQSSKEQPYESSKSQQQVSYGEGIDGVLCALNGLILCIKNARKAIIVCLLIAVGVFLIYNFTGRPEGEYVSLNTDRTYVLKGGFFKKNCGELEVYEDGKRVLDTQEDSEWKLDENILTFEVDGDRIHFYYTGKAIIELDEDEDGDSPEWLGTFDHGNDERFNMTLNDNDGVRYEFKDDGTVLVAYDNWYAKDRYDSYSRMGDVIYFAYKSGSLYPKFYIYQNKITYSYGVYKRK